ncbi:MAG: cyanoglobin [Myxococcales bacterium]|nr:cyanoglobin [Myxococcales bacterium]
MNPCSYHARRDTHMTLDLEQTPYDLLGGRDAVLALSERFYDMMERHEPALTATHRLTEEGRIHPEVRARFGLFLVYWLGGPDDYMTLHGHPRLRMRHRHVAIDAAMRDAWLRSMTRAMDDRGVDGPARRYMDQRFAQVADFLRNTPG